MDHLDTPIFDGRAAVRGYALNKLCYSLNSAANRAAFLRDEHAYCDRFGLDEEQRAAIAHRNVLEMLAAGIRKNLPILEGWRYDAFGHDALDLVEGKMAFAVVNGKLKMTHVDDVVKPVEVAVEVVEVEAEAEAEAEAVSE